VQTILNFHQNFFLPALVQATQQSPIPDHPDPVSLTCDAVGTVFEEKVDFMKMYFEYINNFDEAIRIVEKWQQKDGGTGSRFLKSRMSDERHSQLNLLGYLLLPVQRVPRYRLLLADLVNSSDAPSTRLRSGYEKVEGLAREINDRKAEMEGRKRLVELERTVVSPPTSPNQEDSPFATLRSKFVDPARRLMREDSLQVVVRRKKVHGGLTWEKPLAQRCLAVSCSDKLFLVPFFFWRCLIFSALVMNLQINLLKCGCLLRFPLKMLLPHVVGNLRPNSGSLYLKERLLQKALKLMHSVERRGDSDATGRKMFQCGSKLLEKPQNERAAVDRCTNLLVVFARKSNYYVVFHEFKGFGESGICVSRLFLTSLRCGISWFMWGNFGELLLMYSGISICRQRFILIRFERRSRSDIYLGGSQNPSFKI
jgi:RhoGEF domain